MYLDQGGTGINESGLAMQAFCRCRPDRGLAGTLEPRRHGRPSNAQEPPGGTVCGQSAAALVVVVLQQVHT